MTQQKQTLSVTPNIDFTKGKKFLPARLISMYRKDVASASAESLAGCLRVGANRTTTNLDAYCGEYQTLVAGENTFTYTPVDNVNNNLEVIERVAIQFSGLQDSGNTDTILINNVAVTFDP